MLILILLISKIAAFGAALKEHRTTYYSNLLLSLSICKHCDQIDHRMTEKLMKKMLLVRVLVGARIFSNAFLVLLIFLLQINDTG